MGKVIEFRPMKVAWRTKEEGDELCSFCGRPGRRAKLLVTGRVPETGAAFICHSCISACVKLLEETKK